MNAWILSSLVRGQMVLLIVKSSYQIIINGIFYQPYQIRQVNYA